MGLTSVSCIVTAKAISSSPHMLTQLLPSVTLISQPLTLWPLTLWPLGFSEAQSAILGAETLDAFLQGWIQKGHSGGSLHSCFFLIHVLCREKLYIILVWMWCKRLAVTEWSTNCPSLIRQKSLVINMFHELPTFVNKTNELSANRR